MLKILVSSHADDGGESAVTCQLLRRPQQKATWCVWSTCWADFKEALAEMDESRDEQRRHGGAALGVFVSDPVFF